MSTQSSGSLASAFSISTPFRAVRLLELPDDLLATLTDTSVKKVKFKSGPVAASTSASTATTGGGQKEPTLHLCTDQKAWAVKQVSTSNSVYLIEPCRPIGDDVEMSGGDDVIERATSSSLSAVAQVGSFLELHPVKIDNAVVERAVLDLVPIHHPLRAGEDVDLDLQAANEKKAPLQLGQLLDDVAAPDKTVKTACARLSLFEAETKSGTKCLIPSTRAVLDVWTKIIEGSAIEGISLDSDLNVVRLLNLLASNETDSAIAETLFDTDGTFDVLNLFHENTRKLKREELCRFIAGLILSCHPTRQMNAEEFMTRWTDAVPAVFVKHCTLELLTSPTPSLFEVQNEKLSWNGPVSLGGVVLVPALYAEPVAGNTHGEGGGSGGGTVVAASSAAVDKKRKWHEKFGAQRNMKR